MNVETRYPTVPPHLTLKAARLKQRLENGTAIISRLDPDEVAIIVSDVMHNADLYRALPSKENAVWWTTFLKLCAAGNPTTLMIQEWLLMGNGYLDAALRSLPPEKRRQAFANAGCAYRGINE